jgi:hypothetical protein
MGLRQLEWHEGKHGAWVARVKYSNSKYRRFADVNVFDWIGYGTRDMHKGKIPVAFTPMQYGQDVEWHDSIEAAKLHVEAIFALDD